MNQETDSRTPFIAPVALSDERTRSSTAIFALLCVLPMLACIAFGGVDTGTWALIPIFILAIVLLWIYDAWRSGAFLISTAALQLPLAGLLAIGLIQLLPTPARSLDPYATRFFVVRLIAYFVFFAAALAFVNSMARVRKMFHAIVYFGGVMAFYSILQRLADPGTILGLRVPEQAIPFGTFVNQHHFAAFMVMTTGLGSAYVFSTGSPKEKRLIIGVACLVMSVALIFTSSRGGLLAFLVSLIVSFVYTYSRQKRESRSRVRVLVLAGGVTAAVLLVAAGGLLLLGGDSSLERYIGSWGGKDVSSGRTHFWAVALQIFGAHPVFGAGLDAFGVAFTRYDTWDGTFRVEQAHNDYLQTLADAGIAGMLCVVSFITLLVRRAARTIKAAGDPQRSSIAIGAFAGCVGVLVHSFFDFPLRTPSNAFFFLLLAALATVTVEADQRIRTARSFAPHARTKRT